MYIILHSFQNSRRNSVSLRFQKKSTSPHSLPLIFKQFSCVIDKPKRSLPPYSNPDLPEKDSPVPEASTLRYLRRTLPKYHYNITLWYSEITAIARNHFIKQFVWSTVRAYCAATLLIYVCISAVLPQRHPVESGRPAVILLRRQFNFDGDTWQKSNQLRLDGIRDRWGVVIVIGKSLQSYEINGEYIRIWWLQSYTIWYWLFFNTRNIFNYIYVIVKFI